MIINIALLYSNILYSQNTTHHNSSKIENEFLFINDKSNKKSDSLSFAMYVNSNLGIRYPFTKLDNASKQNNEYKTRPVLTTGLCFDFWGNSKNYLGFDLLFFKYPYTSGHTSNAEYELDVDAYYRRNIKIVNDFYLSPQVGLTVFSTNPNPLLTFSTDLSLIYEFDQIQLFAKNSFRFSPRLHKYTPWILSFGAMIKILEK